MKDGYFAIKRLYSTNELEWKSEIEILKRFTVNPNPHLISLLATYEQSSHVHLIFYWADADLQKFWKVEKPNPPPGLKTARWVARQCRGIASGIVEIHRHLTKKSESSEGHNTNSLYGRHGDIKPRNILWFKDGPDPDGMGTLVITDFGVAEMNSRNSRSGKCKTLMKLSPTYCAPEAYVPGAEIRQSYDIWTLGCVYLEFLAWLVGGWKLVHEFALLRQNAEPSSPSKEERLDRFFELETGSDNIVTGAKVNTGVVEFFETLRFHPASTDFVREFVDVIRTELLIVETKERPRLTSLQLLAALWRMERELKANPAYGKTLVDDEHVIHGEPPAEDKVDKVREFQPRATV